MKTSLCVPHGGRTVNGTLFRPEAERFPLVVFSHGFNGCQTDFYPMAERLNALGIGAYAYDFCGGGTRDTSGFPTWQMSLDTEVQDLCAVLTALRALPEVDERRVILFGASQGGMVSALVAAQRAEEVAALALLFPAFCIPDDWNARYPDGQDVPERIDFWGVTLGACYYEAARDLKVMERIGGYRGPVLIMHGTEDPIVPLRYAEEAAEVYADARLIRFPGEGHGFSPEGDARMVEETLRFVRGQLEG